MEKRVTIKDIAQEVGVSTGTVHRALYGKKGVSRGLQETILEVCTRRGYSANTAASALKRGPVRVVAAFPGPDEKNQYFYSSVWRGFRRHIAELRDYNLDVVELPYYQNTPRSQAVELADCFKRYEGEIDALITVGHFDQACKAVVQSYTSAGIPVFLACDDTSDCGRIACVQAHYRVTGRIVAELLSGQVPSGSTLAVLTGDVLIPSHYRTVMGFEEYIRDHCPDLRVLKLDGYYNEPELLSRLGDILADEKVRGAFSVSARLSVLLAGQVAARGRAGQMRVVASDLFAENVQNMERGIVTNIMYKDPEQQTYLAAKVMSDYVLKALRPVEEVQYVESRVIFRSGLELFR